MHSWDSPYGTTTLGLISFSSLRYQSRSQVAFPYEQDAQLMVQCGSFAWILVPSYLSYVLAFEILEGLTFSAEAERKTR
jgi:hypothetical protein